MPIDRRALIATGLAARLAAGARAHPPALRFPPWPGPSAGIATPRSSMSW